MSSTRKSTYSVDDPAWCGPVMILPWLRHVLPFSRVFQSARSSPQQMRRVTSSSISQHKQTKESEMPRDFIDFYLNKFDETTGIYFSSSPAFCSTSTSATLTSTSSPSLASCISAQSKKSSSQQEIEVGFPTCHWKFQ